MRRLRRRRSTRASSSRDRRDCSERGEQPPNNIR
jgi:hypothetical protein